eukprot:7391888-Prymnesium_polylepis.2
MRGWARTEIRTSSTAEAEAVRASKVGGEVPPPPSANEGSLDTRAPPPRTGGRGELGREF